jgi:hypothetical protein
MNSKEYNFVWFSFQIPALRGNIKMDKEIPNVQKLSQLINPTLFYIIIHDFLQYELVTSRSSEKMCIRRHLPCRE